MFYVFEGPGVTTLFVHLMGGFLSLRFILPSHRELAQALTRIIPESNGRVCIAKENKRTGYGIYL